VVVPRIQSMAEDSKLKKRYILLTGIVIFLAISLIFFRSSLDKALIASVLGVAYLSGIISLLFGIIFSILAYMVSLPILATLHAYIAFILAKINYIVFRVIVRKILRRMGWYRNLELLVKNSSIVKRGTEALHGFLKNLGIEKPRKIKFFEVTECKNCEKDIPIDGHICPYCGDKVGDAPKS